MHVRMQVPAERFAALLGAQNVADAHDARALAATAAHGLQPVLRAHLAAARPHAERLLVLI